MTTKILSSRSLAYCLVLLFIVLKSAHLDYPFFWDESWPYASAIHEMYKVGPSLSPSAIPPELSRGHPTLFIFLVSVWMKLFGTSLTAIHSFPLFIAALFSLAIYETGRKLFSARTGVLALLLIIFQAVFFVQASFVLLEVFLAFFGLLSLYFYAKGKLTLLSLSLLILFFTKESGLALGLTLGIVSLVRLAIKDIDGKMFLRHLVAFGLPLLAIVIFFQIQKDQLGWYFFPYHVELMETGFKAVARKIQAGLIAIFIAGYRNIIMVVVLAMSVLFYLKYREQDLAGRVKRSLRSMYQRPWSDRVVFVSSSVVFIGIFTLYSAFNFFTLRYFLIALVPAFMLIAAFVSFIAKYLHRAAFAGSVLFVVGFHFFALNNADQIFDVELGAFDGMKVEQEMTAFLEDNYNYSTPIASNAFLLRTQLTDPRTRYLRSEEVFTNVGTQVTEETRLAIFTNKEVDDQIDRVKTDPQFRLAKRFERNEAWAEVYERVP